MAARARGARTTRTTSPTRARAKAPGPNPTSNSQNLAVSPGSALTQSGRVSSTIEPHQTTETTTKLRRDRGRASRAWPISRQRGADRTRSRRWRHQLPSLSGGTGSASSTSSSEASRERCTWEKIRAEANSSQAKGRARGNVMSRPTVVARNVMTTEKLTAPMIGPRATLPSSNQVAGRRHGRRSSSITVSP